jgi:hypothetical protein
MDALKTNHSVSGTEDSDIQNYNANFLLNGRTFPYQAEVSDKLPKTVSQKEEKKALPKLYVIKGPMEGREYELEKKTMFIGRSSGNDIKFKDIMVSRKHL